MQFTSRGSKMTGLVSTQIIQWISFLIVCSVTTIFQDIGRSSWHWGKSSSQQLLSVLYSVLEEELSRAPTLSLCLQEAEMQPPCHSAFWHRATWLSATKPGFLQLLSWVDTARFPQQLSWCVYTAAFLTAPCAELAALFSLLSPFPISFWGCCGRACSGMGLSIWPHWNLTLCITETFCGWCSFHGTQKAISIQKHSSPPWGWTAWRSAVMHVFQKQTIREERSVLIFIIKLLLFQSQLKVLQSIFFFSSLKKCPLYHHSQSVANVLLLKDKLFQSVSAGSLGCCCCFSEVMGLEENLHLRGTDTQTLFYCMGTKTVRVEGGLLLLSHFCSILGLAGSSGCLCGFHGSSISVPENIQIFFF